MDKIRTLIAISTCLLCFVIIHTCIYILHLASLIDGSVDLLQMLGAICAVDEYTVGTRLHTTYIVVALPCSMFVCTKCLCSTNYFTHFPRGSSTYRHICISIVS